MPLSTNSPTCSTATAFSTVISTRGLTFSSCQCGFEGRFDYAAIGTVSNVGLSSLRRSQAGHCSGQLTEQLITAYLERLATDMHPDAILLRTRTGAPYGREPLAHDFAEVRALAPSLKTTDA